MGLFCFRTGKQPRGRQYGYIYTKGLDPSKIGSILAHELAHGKFKLYHTFDNIYAGKLAQGSTTNLMDYTGGTHLAKWQWNQLYDPAILNGVFDRDEDGEYSGDIDWISEFIKEVRFARHKNQQNLDITKWKKYLDGGGINNKSVYLQNRFYGILNVKRSHAGVNVINIQKITVAEAVVTIGDKANNRLVQFEVRNNNSYHSPELAIELKTYLEAANYQQDLIQELKPNRILLFVNGFRPQAIFSSTQNNIMFGDDLKYWEGIDKSFINRIAPDSKNIYYANGHMSITTSNHNVDNDEAKSILKFYCSANNLTRFFSNDIKEQILNKLKYSQPYKSYAVIESVCRGVGLSITPNPDGFNTRRIEGRIAGRNLLKSMKSNPRIYFDDNGKSPNKLYIVCHSMGYAYALGMIDVLKDKVPFGSLYILAPENAESGGADWSMFDEVWQYGSDETKDPDKLQDGVAPQVPVSDIENKFMNPNGGRVYIPDDQPKGFLVSHSIGSFKWVFEKKEKERGYVKQR